MCPTGTPLTLTVAGIFTPSSTSSVAVPGGVPAGGGGGDGKLFVYVHTRPHHVGESASQLSS